MAKADSPILPALPGTQKAADQRLEHYMRDILSAEVQRYGVKHWDISRVSEVKKLALLAIAVLDNPRLPEEPKR